MRTQPVPDVEAPTSDQAELQRDILEYFGFATASTDDELKDERFRDERGFWH